MSPSILYIAITNHGFGHAVRAACVAAEIQKIDPEILIAFVTAAPRWLLASYVPGDFIYRPRAFDVGVVQSDSLAMDKSATLEKLKEIRQRQYQIVAGEVSFIRTNRVGLVFADIPPLAVPIAKAAGVPCWMASNFGWDFIYRDWGADFEGVADWIAECFAGCDRLFRLPFHEPMAAFPHKTDVGLTGGTPKYEPEEVRSRLGISTPRERTVLLSFGGLGLQGIPYANATGFADWQFLTFDRNAPDLPNLKKIAGDRYRPVDLMPICGAIVSKPGYSTFAEALRLDVPLVSLRREGFAESPLLLAALQKYGTHRIVSVEEFATGTWEFLRQPFEPPQSSEKLAKDGSEAIARAIVDYFRENR